MTITRLELRDKIHTCYSEMPGLEHWNKGCIERIAKQIQLHYVKVEFNVNLTWNEKNSPVNFKLRAGNGVITLDYVNHLVTTTLYPYKISWPSAHEGLFSLAALLGSGYLKRCNKGFDEHLLESKLQRIGIYTSVKMYMIAVAVWTKTSRDTCQEALEYLKSLYAPPPDLLSPNQNPILPGLHGMVLPHNLEPRFWQVNHLQYFINTCQNHFNKGSL